MGLGVDLEDQSGWQARREQVSGTSLAEYMGTNPDP